MENRKGTPSIRRKRPPVPTPIFYFQFLLFAILIGCGAPGEPTPPLPPIPEPITDLAGQQVGDGARLTFTMPGKSTLGLRLTETPAFEVLRGSARADGKPDPKSFRVVDAVPGALVSRYSQRGQIIFVDPVAPTDPQLRSGQAFLYRVRTLISEKHPSPDSNDVSIHLYPVPEAIASLSATVTERGIELKWTPPARTSSGEPLPAVEEFHIYRGERNPHATGHAGSQEPQSEWKSPLMQLGVTTSPEYRDSGFDYDQPYAYVVRSVVDSPAGPLESNDSNQIELTPKDIFPPAAPQGMVVAILPGADPSASVVELSWAINVEPDLAGYRVYRSEKEGERGSLLTPAPLPSPTYRDTTVQSGQHYWYTVTAVDHAGNESVPSSAVAVEVAQPSR
jgi:hypothetical protein